MLLDFIIYKRCRGAHFKEKDPQPLPNITKSKQSMNWRGQALKNKYKDIGDSQTHTAHHLLLLVCYTYPQPQNLSQQPTLTIDCKIMTGYQQPNRTSGKMSSKFIRAFENDPFSKHQFNVTYFLTYIRTRLTKYQKPKRKKKIYSGLLKQVQDRAQPS